MRSSGSNRPERSLDQMEGRVEAYDLGRTSTRGPTLEEELAGLEADGVVDEELAALKARMGNRLPVADKPAGDKPAGDRSAE